MPGDASCSCQRLDDVNSLLGSWSYSAIKWTSLSAKRQSSLEHFLEWWCKPDRSPAIVLAIWLYYVALLISGFLNIEKCQYSCGTNEPHWNANVTSRTCPVELSALFQSCIGTKLAGDQNQNWVSMDLVREHWTSHSQGTSQVWEDRALEIPSDHGITP